MSQYQPPRNSWPPQLNQSGSEQQYPQWQQPSQPLPPQQQWQQVPPQPQSVPQPNRTGVPKTPKKRAPYGWIITSLIIGILIGYVIHTPGSQASPTATTPQATSTQNTSQPTSQPTKAATHAAVTPTPAHTFLTFGDGIFQVGKDIKPGTYRTRVGSTNCYYARLKSFDTTAIISNNNTDAPAVITIAATDKAFQSENCGTWTNDLSAITSSRTSFGDGIYIVGTDITPGTYKNTASTGCYYARLSAFDTSAIISNNNTDAVAIVTIAASDKGFQSNNCGTWTKL